MEPQLNPAGLLLAGAAAAMTEVMTTGHLLLRWKIARQNNKSMEWHPRLLARGLPAHLGLQTGSVATSFAVNELTRNFLSGENGTATPYQQLMSLLTASVASGSVASPVEKGLQQNGGYLHAMHVGMSATIMRELGFNSGLLFLYPWIKDKITQRMPGEENKATVIALATFVSGTIAAVTSHPFEEIRGKLQQKENPHKGMYHAAVHMLKTGGVKAFYPSVVPRWLRICVAIWSLDKANAFYKEKLLPWCKKE